MRIIELDAAKWKTVLDFYHALLASIGAPKWHSFDRFNDLGWDERGRAAVYDQNFGPFNGAERGS